MRRYVVPKRAAGFFRSSFGQLSNALMQPLTGNLKAFDGLLLPGYGLVQDLQQVVLVRNFYFQLDDAAVVHA